MPVSKDASRFLSLYSDSDKSLSLRAKLVLEDGYEVTTVVDGHKSGLNQHTVHALPGSSSNLIREICNLFGACFCVGYVTTIAGGISNEFGHRDGPAHNATFSSDFEITFINLKEEDCLEISHTSLGSYSLWSVGVVLSCFLGIALLLALTSLIMKKRITTGFIMTWKLLLIKLGKQVRTFFSYVRNLVAGSVLICLVMMLVSHLSLMYSAISRLD
ncbi:hypothetical protein IGI04_026827 [Brassica rapa subsp. trilocularis]|uniref:Uncharacterized protein n=1 Tax=Brassica rapa subsp. trilocularis TaxID=1813537 RepID=A0ABQ7KZW4_BRACM|nr:hypothetical protein IGI04_026827 [Brassica rapa subsp. trilocularis]